MLNGPLIRPIPEQFPNRLASPVPDRPRLPSRVLILAGLCLLCLLLRTFMGTRLASLCPDGLLYIQIAQKVEAGDLQGGLGETQLNIYPMVLAALHRLGLPWELAGKYWGVLISSLVVLPLYGWVRRQFDDRVAFWACFLYAVHADLIAWSPETMRDSTFWFLFVLAIYLLWRAITEVRLTLFAAAGMVTVLAIVTRVEALLLLVPLALWSWSRWRALEQGRGRLAAGVLVCLAVPPLLVVLANLAWLGAHGRWELPRLRPVAQIGPWVESLMGAAEGDKNSRPADASVAALPFGRMARIFVPTLVRGLTPLFALFLLLGLWGWRRTWFRRDHQPLFYLAMLILLGMWVGLWTVGSSCPRYVFPIVLTGSGFAALGWLWIAGLCRAAWESRAWGRRWAVVPTLATAIVMTGLGLGGAAARDCRFRNAQVDLGRWLHQTYGPSPRLVAPDGAAQVIAYYAGAQCRSFPQTASPEAVVAMVRQFRPKVVLLQPTSRMTGERCDEILEGVSPLGWQRVDTALLPPGCEGLLVLARHPRDSDVARRETR
jgi:hypothetical protein